MQSSASGPLDSYKAIRPFIHAQSGSSAPAIEELLLATSYFASARCRSGRASRSNTRAGRSSGFLIATNAEECPLRSVALSLQEFWSDQ